MLLFIINCATYCKCGREKENEVCRSHLILVKVERIKIAFCCWFGEKIKTKQPQINKQLDSSKGLIVPHLEYRGS